MSTATADSSLPATSSPPAAARHFPALDGLRGVAILIVVFFHAYNTFSWSSPHSAIGDFALKTILTGWIGVDIFFVLSGFLISGILLDARGAQHYFRNFYARRLLRIIPVYYLMLAIVLIGFRWLIPFDTPEIARLIRNQAWLWTHTTNWGFVYGTLVEHKPLFTIANTLDLTHLWTLAVEEQFYLVWPLLIFCLRGRALKAACIGCIVGAFGLRFTLWLCGARLGALYFPTPCRLDGLALGSLIAILFRDPTFHSGLLKSAKLIAPIAIALFGINVASRHGFDSHDAPTVVFGIVAIELIAACVIIFAVVPPTSLFGTQLLNVSPLRLLGRYSYGLYLFHVTILYPLQYRFPSQRFAERIGSEPIGNALYATGFFALSLALAVISWHAYEKWWLRLKRFFPYSSESPANRAARADG